MTRQPVLQTTLMNVINITPTEASVSKRDEQLSSDSSKPDTSFPSYVPSLQTATSCEDVGATVKNETIAKVEYCKLDYKGRFYLGIPKEDYLVIRQLHIECQIKYLHVLITFKKIRTNDKFLRLGKDFARSVSYVKKVFSKTLPKLAARLNELIIWPDAVEIKPLLPVQFKGYFKNVKAIIDCFEVEIEKPSNALEQALTWSQSKKCNTAKFLISCCPNGLVNFISRKCGGRTTDAEIIKNSGYLQKIPRNCRIMMADRGFKRVAHPRLKKSVSIVCPSSIATGSKLTKDEAKETKFCAALRIHVERLIGRVREFAIFGPHACVNHGMIKYLDLIVVVVCGIINLQNALNKS